MRYIKLLILWMFATTAVHAQAIKTLPADPAVKNGVLPNGITYYVVTNPAMKGVADFAMVQKTGSGTVQCGEGQIVSNSQNTLTSLYRLSAPTVQDYFMRHGAMPGKNGFVQVNENSTVYHFENVMLSGSSTVLDSTLLVLMGMAEKASHNDDPVLKGWYAPSDHALIIAGDIDSKAVIEKMKLLSYMIPAQKSYPRKGYQWTEQESLTVGRIEKANPDLFTITAAWRLPRTPREYMNTVQPAISEMFMTEIGIVAGDRIRERLKRRGVPYADVSYDYIDGTESLADEEFRMSVTVSQSDMSQAISAIAAVFSSLDSSDATGYEVRRAGLIYKNSLRAGLKNLESNTEYVDRCVSAFMFNSPLTSRRDMVAFHSSRDLPEADELNIFNSIASASLDGTRNLTLEYSTMDETVTDGTVKGIFESSWTAVRTGGSPVGESVMTSMQTPVAAESVKLKASKKEYMSGGTMWTLSNGFKVVFKPMSADGKVYYSLALNGGYANISDLNVGEGSYMSEMLNLSNVGGVKAADFLNEIRRNGVTMNMNVGFSQFTLKGVAPDDKIDYLMKALSAVMYDSKVDCEALEYYKDCELLRKEYLRGSILDRISYIDSTMCPGYRYSDVRAAASLAPDYAAKAEKLLSELSGKMNDGMLILVGNIDEKKLKTALLTYTAGFKTDDRTFSRPSVNYQPTSGTVTHMVAGDVNSMDIVMSVPMALTADNYYVATIASLALKNELTRAVSRTGMSLRLKHSCRKDPQERFNLMVSLSEASIDGFAPGTAVSDPLVALNAVRGALADPKSLDISSAELAAYKALVKKDIAERKKNPEYWLHAISMRYLDGKDFTTNCDAKIDAVTVDKVKSLLVSLINGTKVEYIISRK